MILVATANPSNTDRGIIGVVCHRHPTWVSNAFPVKLRRDTSSWVGFDKATLSRCFVDSILVV